MSLLIDNELDDEESELLFKHLSDCADCRRSLRLDLQMRSDLKESVPPMAPKELDGKILSAIPTARQYAGDRKPMTSLVWKRRISMPLPVAAAASVLLIVASITMSLLWSRSERAPAETRVQTVYVTALPAVEVQGRYLPPKTTIQ